MQVTNGPAQKSIGGVEHMEFKLKDSLGFDMDMNGGINIMVGQNGTGKTLVNVFVWCTTMGLNLYMILNDQAKVEEMFQFILDKSFVRNDWEGSVLMNFRGGVEVKYDLDKGKLTHFSATGTQGYKAAPAPIYMSTETRLYSAVTKYAKFKTNMGFCTPLNEDGLKKMCDMYKIYDVMRMESLLMMMTKRIKVSDLVNKTFLKEIKMEIKEIWYDENQQDFFYLNGTGDIKSLTAESNGVQALIMMTTLNM